MKEERRRNKRKRIIKFWIRFLIFLLLCGGVYFCLKSPIFNVSEYVVTGANYYNSSEILNMGNCKTGLNIFTGIDPKDMKARLERDAYMQSVEVKRKLPSTVEIHLTERTQIAALVYGEKFVVIDSEGMVLRKASVDPQVPVIKGITLTKLNVGELCEVEESVQLRQAIELIEATNEYKMLFKRVEIEQSGVKCYILDTLACEGKYEDVISNMKNGTLQSVVLNLFDKQIERGTILVTDINATAFSPNID